ncbi:MAG: hypothetical protein M3Q97_04310 [Bacteroidota bacterium]|nr:hypothetical protein [Bacteroidota bacterium]
MKNLIIGTGGHPAYYNDDLSHIMEAVLEAASPLSKMLGDNFFLTNTTVAIAGTVHSCAAGAMFYKGEFCLFDAQNVDQAAFTYIFWKPVITYRALDPVTYADLSSKNPHEIKMVKLTAANALPADYLALENVLTRHNRLLSVLEGSWLTFFTFLNGWAAGGSGWSSFNYRVDKNGKVTFRGYLDATAASANLVCNLPTAVRPGATIILPIMAQGSGFTVENLEILSSGDMSATRGGLHPIYSFNGLSYYL